LIVSSTIYSPRKPAPIMTVLFLAGREESEDEGRDDICGEEGRREKRR